MVVGLVAFGDWRFELRLEETVCGICTVWVLSLNVGGLVEMSEIGRRVPMRLGKVVVGEGGEPIVCIVRCAWRGGHATGICLVGVVF